MMTTTLKLLLWAFLVVSIFANPPCDIQKEAAPFTGGYQHFNNLGYYKLYSTPTYWGFAWKQCNEDGGHLVVIDSDEEYAIVKEIKKNSKRNVYIGVHDIFVEGWFLTVTGKSLHPSSYNKWRNGEPNENLGRDRNCVVMNKNGELRAEGCNEELYFICEVELK